MADKLASGRCLCGKIQFHITGSAVWTGYCHCESCRRFTGSGITNWLGVRDTDLVFTEGKPKDYLPGDGVRRGFCSHCGSSLVYESDRFPEYIQIHLGSLDDPDAIKPHAHVHCLEKIAWLEIDDELPRYPASASENGESWQN